MVAVAVPQLFDARDAAAYLGLKNPATLAVWRCTNRYPLPYVRVGRAIRYLKSDLDAFLVSRTVGASTAIVAR